MGRNALPPPTERPRRLRTANRRRRLTRGWRSRRSSRPPHCRADRAPQKIATRKASQLVLDAVTPVIALGMIGGSADLTGSNNTKAKAIAAVLRRDSYGGSYIYYGIREFGMAAAMNGIALHGLVPAVRRDVPGLLRLQPSTRSALSALHADRVIYVMTHDSIGLGEDGPTHQPVEQLACRCARSPTLLVYRPADAVETAECWALAMPTRHARRFWRCRARTCRSLRTAVSGARI